MDRLRINKIFQENIKDQQACVKGWIKSMRKSKNVGFMVINDGSSQKDFQIVLDADLSNFEDVTKLGVGSSVSVEGNLVQSQGKNQSIEMQAKNVDVIGAAPEDYPLQKKRTSFEFLREVAHIRSRTNTFGAVFRVRHALAMASHEFFDQKGLFYIHTPIITASDCEGAGDMFRVSTIDPLKAPKNDKGEINYAEDYFGKPTYLTVSGQLEAEALALGMGGVYTFAPTFRSENSNTARHLAEFWMVEPEVAFASLDDVADLAAEYIQYLISAVMKRCPDELAFFDQRIKPGLIETLSLVKDTPFKRITYTEAIEILEKSEKKFEYPVKWGADLQTEHERYLAEEYFKSPLTVTDYPKEIKAFYMKLNDDGKTVRAMDVLVPGVGEIIGGSEREDNYEVLKERMLQMGLSETDYKWYLDLRRFGGAPHAGFGLGFERAVMYLTGMSNIRDVIPFARTPKNAEF